MPSHKRTPGPCCAAGGSPRAPKKQRPALQSPPNSSHPAATTFLSTFTFTLQPQGRTVSKPASFLKEVWTELALPVCPEVLRRWRNVAPGLEDLLPGGSVAGNGLTQALSSQAHTVNLGYAPFPSCSSDFQSLSVGVCFAKRGSGYHLGTEL